jgi:serralysin
MPLAPGPLGIGFPVELSPPPTRDYWEEQIAFLSRVAANATVAPDSFGAWASAGAVNAFPANYDPTFSFTTKWGSTILLPFGNPGGTVTYAFDAGYDAVAQDQARSALALWSAEVNISFTQAMDPNAADFTFESEPDGTFALFPKLMRSTIGSSVVKPPGADVHVNIDSKALNPKGDTAPLDGQFDTQGGDAYFALVHELGHLLNLGHTGPYNASPDHPSEVIAATFQLGVYDTMLWSIMSYVSPAFMGAKFFNSYPVTGTNWGQVFDPNREDDFNALPTTPMMLDILAAQRIYGRPTDSPLVDGNDVFGFNVHLGDDKVAKSIERYFDFTVNKHPVITIWDGGVNNTLDLSGWSTPSTINLNPGTFSSANGQVNNIGIARDTVIETAKGGQGSDTIIGNDYANFLFGNAGDDTLNGGPGDDTLTGGLGADRFVLAKISDGVDTFLDFSRIQHDQIALDHGGFDLGGTGTLAAVGVSLINGATAEASTPTILYNAGDVSWDPDGTGSDAPALLAHVLTAEAPTVAANPAAPGPTMVSSTSAAQVFPQLFPDDFVIV